MLFIQKIYIKIIYTEINIAQNQKEVSFFFTDSGTKISHNWGDKKSTVKTATEEIRVLFFNEIFRHQF